MTSVSSVTGLSKLMLRLRPPAVASVTLTVGVATGVGVAWARAGEGGSDVDPCEAAERFCASAWSCFWCC